MCAVALAYRSSRLLRTKGLARSGAGRTLARLHRQHGVRDCFADRDGHDADHAGGVCAASPEMANQPDDLRRLAVLAGLAWVTSPQLQRTSDDFFADYQLYKTENAATSIGLGSSSGRNRWGSLPRRRSSDMVRVRPSAYSRGQRRDKFARDYRSTKNHSRHRSGCGSNTGRSRWDSCRSAVIGHGTGSTQGCSRRRRPGHGAAQAPSSEIRTTRRSTSPSSGARSAS